MASHQLNHHGVFKSRLVYVSQLKTVSHKCSPRHNRSRAFVSVRAAGNQENGNISNSNPTSPVSTSSATKFSSLANTLLMNAASLLTSDRKTAHCVSCQGTGLTECTACKGAGILAPEKVAKMNTIKHAAHKLSSIISFGNAPQYDDDWVRTNRCKRCRGTGRVICAACAGTGRRYPANTGT